MDTNLPTHPHIHTLRPSRPAADTTTYIDESPPVIPLTDSSNPFGTCSPGVDARGNGTAGFNASTCWPSSPTSLLEQYENLAAMLHAEIRAHNHTRVSLEQQVAQLNYDVSSWAAAYEDCCSCLNKYIQDFAALESTKAGVDRELRSIKNKHKARPPPPNPPTALGPKMVQLLKRRISKEGHTKKRGVISEVLLSYTDKIRARASVDTLTSLYTSAE